MRIRSIAAGCGVAIYFAAALLLKIEYDPAVIEPGVVGRVIALHRPYTLRGEGEFISPDYFLAKYAGKLSAVTLYEDDHRLLHIEHVAGKVYSSEAAFVFSSSDGTDARTNGRSYWAVLPAGGTEN